MNTTKLGLGLILLLIYAGEGQCEFRVDLEQRTAVDTNGIRSAGVTVPGGDGSPTTHSGPSCSVDPNSNIPLPCCYWDEPGVGLHCRKLRPDSGRPVLTCEEAFDPKGVYHPDVDGRCRANGNEDECRDIDPPPPPPTPVPSRTPTPSPTPTPIVCSCKLFGFPNFYRGQEMCHPHEGPCIVDERRNRLENCDPTNRRCSPPSPTPTPSRVPPSPTPTPSRVPPSPTPRVNPSPRPSIGNPTPTPRPTTSGTATPVPTTPFPKLSSIANTLNS